MIDEQHAIHLWAISGFLGLATDWDVFDWKTLKGVNIFDFDWNDLSAWTKALNRQCEPLSHSANVLMGYSLGGRLAMHALLDQPQQWQAAIIISAHPGLQDDLSRAKRLINDEQWAKRFRCGEWNSVIQDWNAQPVFEGSMQFERQEKDYERSKLADLLIKGSLAKQADLREDLCELNIPILWLTGEKDDRYSHIAKGMLLKHPLSRVKVFSEAGHRLPWQQPQLFKSEVENFLYALGLRI